MKQLWKRVLPFFLCLLMLVTLLPQAVLADENGETAEEAAAVETIAAEESVEPAEEIGEVVPDILQETDEAEVPEGEEAAAQETGPVVPVEDVEDEAAAPESSASELLTSLKIDDLEILEGTDCYRSSDYDEKTDTFKEYLYYNPLDSKKLKVTAVYDGQEISGTFYDVRNTIYRLSGEWASYSYEADDQSYESQWTAGKTYSFKLIYLGKEASFKVSIKKSLLTSFKAEDFTITENTGGYEANYYDYETGESKSYYYYYPTDSSNLKVTAVYDGEEITGSYAEVIEQLRELTGESIYNDSVHNQGYENQWKVGNTYPLSLYVMNKKADVNVTIRKSLLTSLTVKDIEIPAYTCGGETSDWDSETGEWQYYYRYYPTNKIELTAVYDGKKITGTLDEVREQLEELEGIYISYNTVDSQGYNNQWKEGNTYPYSIKMLNKTAEFKITITKCPLTSLKIDNFEILEYTNGNERSYWDSDAQENRTYFYYAPENSSKLTVTAVVNGQEISGTMYNVRSKIEDLTGEWVYPRWSYVQGADNQWTAGGKYPVAVSLMGQTAEAEVTIKKNLMESLKVDDIELMEYTGGYYSSDWDPDTQKYREYYYYTPQDSYNLRATAVYNGEEITGTLDQIRRKIAELTGESISINFISDQSYNNQWTADNKYPVSVSLLGKKAEFEVTIKKSLLTSFKIDDIEILEETNGYYYGSDSSNYRYSEFLSKLNITAVYDGQEISGTFWSVENELEDLVGESGLYNTLTTDQSDQNPWKPGNTYSANMTFMGIKSVFAVKIKKAALTSFKVDDVEITEETNGYYNSYWDPETNSTQYWYYYTPQDSNKLHVTVVYDGKEISGTMREVCDEIGNMTGENISVTNYSDQSSDKQWTVGNKYPVTLRLFQQKAEFQTSIIKSPLTSLKINDLDIVENTCGYSNGYWDEATQETQYYYRYYPDESTLLKATIVYNGTTYTGTFNQIRTQLTIEEDEDIDFSWVIQTDQNPQNQWTVGNTYTATVRMMGQKSTFKVNIKKSQLTSVKVDDIEITEGTSGTYATNYDTGNGPQEYFRYSLYYGIIKNMSAVYGGKTYSGTGSEVMNKLSELTGARIYPEIIGETPQSPDNPWVAGKTYPAFMELIGKKASFNIKIKKSLLTSFALDDIEILEETNGYYVNGPDRKEYYQYNITNRLLKGSLVYNGKTYKGTYSQMTGPINSQLVEESAYSLPTIALRTSQTADSPWLPGQTYHVKAYYLGRTCTFNVKIIKGVTPTAIHPLSGSTITFYNNHYYNSNVLGVKYDPANGKQRTAWTVEDPSIIALSGETARPGFTFLKTGTTKVTATSKINPQLKQTFTVSIVNGNPPAGTYSTSVLVEKAEKNGSYNGLKDPIVNPTSLTMQKGDVYHMEVNVFSETCIPVMSQNTVAKQLSNMIVEAYGGSGSMTSEDGSHISSNTIFTLTAKEKGISVLKIGDYTLTVTVNDKNDKAVLFNDVKDPNAWFYTYVYQIAGTKNKKGSALMSGYKNGSGNFGPTDPLTRQDFAVILYRMAEEPAVGKTNKSAFPDADTKGYYYDAIVWAKDQKVITGYNDGRFGVGDNITREQVATILYRYSKDSLKLDVSAAQKEGKANWKLFKDYKAVSEFATDALQWANGAGIITGKDNGTKIDPQGNAARAEIAAMVLRFQDYLANKGR